RRAGAQGGVPDERRAGLSGDDDGAQEGRLRDRGLYPRRRRDQGQGGDRARQEQGLSAVLHDRAGRVGPPHAAAIAPRRPPSAARPADWPGRARNTAAIWRVLPTGLAEAGAQHGGAGMAPLIYPEPTWSNRFGRVVRTVQIVAIAGAIGAVGGGIAVTSLVGTGNSSRPPTALKITADNSGAPAVGAAPAAPQPAAAAAPVEAAARAAAPPAPAGAQAGPQQAPQSPAPAEPSSTAAATDQHPVEEAAVPAGSAPGTQVYNRAEPEQKAAPAHARARPKPTRRIRNAERGRREQNAPYPADRNASYSYDRGAPYPADRGARYSDGRDGPYSGERYSYRDYDRPPVVRGPPPAMRGGYYAGGGGMFYDRGGWGD